MPELKSTAAKRVIHAGLVASLTLAASLIGCRSNAGPWSGQAYQTPTAGSPAHQTIITPGAPSPFEQTLPSGNNPKNSAMGSSTR